jgi:hypothetical protein
MSWEDIGEVWSDIVGFEGYLVSTRGNVKSDLSGKILKPLDNGNGYKKVSLRKDNKTHERYIHRLVALHFVPSGVDCPEVDHINNIKDDNRVDNLRWVDRSDNSKNYCRDNRRGYKLKQLSQLQVLDILVMHLYGMSSVQIGRELGIPRQTVYSCVKVYCK